MSYCGTRGAGKLETLRLLTDLLNPAAFYSLAFSISGSMEALLSAWHSCFDWQHHKEQVLSVFIAFSLFLKMFEVKKFFTSAMHRKLCCKGSTTVQFYCFSCVNHSHQCYHYFWKTVKFNLSNNKWWYVSLVFFRLFPLPQKWQQATVCTHTQRHTLIKVRSEKFSFIR